MYVKKLRIFIFCNIASARWDTSTLLKYKPHVTWAHYRPPKVLSILCSMSCIFKHDMLTVNEGRAQREEDRLVLNPVKLGAAVGTRSASPASQCFSGENWQTWWLNDLGKEDDLAPISWWAVVGRIWIQMGFDWAVTAFGRNGTAAMQPKAPNPTLLPFAPCQWVF